MKYSKISESVAIFLLDTKIRPQILLLPVNQGQVSGIGQLQILFKFILVSFPAIFYLWALIK